MPSKPRSRKRYSEKKRGKGGPVSSATPSRVAAPVAPVVTPPEAVEHQTSRVSPPEVAVPGYAYVARELKQIALVAGIALALLIILFIFLR